MRHPGPVSRPHSVFGVPSVRLVTVLAGVVLAGCSADAVPELAYSDDGFCREVEPRVSAFLRERREASGSGITGEDGGTVVVGGIEEMPTGMNVAASAEYVASQHQQFVNLMTLVAYDEELEPRPWLAESWELSPDGSELTFRIRQDVDWHDGEPTDAHDVAFTYRLLTDPDTGFPNAGFWDSYVPGPEGVQVVDDHTVRVRLRPHADYLDPWRAVAILPEHLLADVRPEELAGHPYGARCPVGNGPFVFAEHREQESWRFVANPGFPEELGGRPHLDAYVYRVVPDANTLLLELLSGGIDVYITPQPDQVAAIVDAQQLELRSYPFRNVTFAAWNARRPQLADPRVRRALTLAVDRDEVVEVLLQGFGQVAHGTVPPWHWAHDADVGRLPHDPARARELLEAAGWRDRDGDGVREDASGSPLAISLKSNQGNRRLQRLATILQERYRAIGVSVRVETVEWGTLVEQITTPELRDFDGVLLSWVTEFKLDDSDLFRSDRVDAPYGFSGTVDPELDRYLDTLPGILDRSEARTVWTEYQARLAEVQPYTFFYFPDRLDGLNRRVRDVVMDARGEWVNLREWRIAPEDRGAGR